MCEKCYGLADAAVSDERMTRGIAQDEINKQKLRDEIQRQVDKAFQDPEFLEKARQAIEKKQPPPWTVRGGFTVGRPGAEYRRFNKS